jgi:16S rRNA (cytosine1402-N4)-methyltransferase
MTIKAYSTYHIPVLLKEAAFYLITNPKGIYVDGTVGGGGHAEYILKNFKNLKHYVAIDQDREALQFSQQRLQQSGGNRNVSFHHCNFSQFDMVLNELDLQVVDGLLLDLGVAGYQIDMPERGFSYMQSCPLDMRMNQESSITAADILNAWAEQDLARIFTEYGEEKKARQIARLIIRNRQKEPLHTSDHLKKIINQVSNRQQVIKSYARIFQALRITVNDELKQLEIFLQKAVHFLKSGGRLVIIAYHSLEDRLVKNFFKTQTHPCICPPELPYCVCGKKPILKIITKKPIRADEQEISVNIRARSALLRVGEKI